MGTQPLAYYVKKSNKSENNVDPLLGNLWKSSKRQTLLRRQKIDKGCERKLGIILKQLISYIIL